MGRNPAEGKTCLEGDMDTVAFRYHCSASLSGKHALQSILVVKWCGGRRSSSGRDNDGRGQDKTFARWLAARDLTPARRAEPLQPPLANEALPKSRIAKAETRGWITERGYEQQ